MEKMLQPRLLSTYYLSATCHCLESIPNSLAAIKCSITMATVLLLFYYFDYAPDSVGPQAGDSVAI